MFFHGTSSECLKDHFLLPPSATGVLSEKGRKKNLDRVFFTADIGSAKIYAGRACRQFGGTPVIYRVIPMTEVECINADHGSSVFHSGWAFVEPINP